MMKVSNRLAACAALLLVAAPPMVRAQDKPGAEASPEVTVPGKLQVVLTEYEGTNKISSLPYTIPIMVTNKFAGHMYSLRMGMRIPVTTTSSKTGESSINYIDVGTNIDSRANRAADGRFVVDLTIERSSVYVTFRDKDGAVHGKEWTSGEPPPGTEPMIRQFRGEAALLLRDGQQSEATIATDPLTGRVIKVEVLLTVLK
jgi:hypothetical protein